MALLNTEVGFRGDGLVKGQLEEGSLGKGALGAGEPYPAEILL